MRQTGHPTLSRVSRLRPFGWALALLPLGCSHGAPAKAPRDPVREALAGLEDRQGVVFATDPWGDGATRLVYLDQGWSVPETLWYYYADQGSTLMPTRLLTHLEQPDNERLLVDPENLARFRFLNQRPSPNNPDALPVGFSRHGDAVGLTCAACHTGQLTYKGTAIRVDGAPAMANITGFFEQIRASMQATLADPAKLERFVTATAGPRGADPAHREAAKKSVVDTLAWFDAYLRANQSTTAEGYGRLDAVGRILNQVIAFTSDRKNCVEPNAPNSFPLLWDAPRHDYVQWAGFSPNADVGSLGRNVGEVIGVYGQIEVKRYDSAKEAKKGYPSTVQGHALVAMEDSLHALQSPLWPEAVLPPIDRSKAAAGATLYEAHCLRCHALIDRDDPRRTVTAMITAVDVVGTDPQSVDNFINTRAPTGVLEGAISTDGETRYGATESGVNLLKDLVVGALSAQPTAAALALGYAKRNGLEETKKQGDHHPATEADPTADLRSYKARPLNGIWASAPYLHNGSVPSLYDLLRPAAERPARFAVGRWEYDPIKVGYVSEGEAPWVLDTSLTGNHNVGHEYGTALSTEDRWALVEYLKTL